MGYRPGFALPCRHWQGRIQKIQRASGRETCQNQEPITLPEFYKNIRKRGGHDPLGPPQNPPMGGAFLSLAHY